MSKIITDPKLIDELLTRRINEIIPGKETFKKLLLSGKRLRIYQGFDPSRPNLHIGHLVGLMQLKLFQNLGHEVIFLIGDFTGMIGDPTDKTATRPKLTRSEVNENAQTYKDQAGKILDFEGDNPAIMKFNSTWLDKLNFADVLELSSNFTVQQLMERDMFQARFKEQKPIYLHEFMYPLVQGYDSVAMEVDVEIGGNDQLFNMIAGRHLMKTLKNKEKFVMTTKLLTDGEGRKIGKTTGNAINLFDDPNDVFGQTMALPDETVIPAFEMITNLSMEEITEFKKEMSQKPMELKKRLGWEIVNMIRGNNIADQAQEHFEKTVQAKELPEDIPTIEVKKVSANPIELAEFLVEAKLASSKSDARRLIEQNAVKIDEKVINDKKATIELKPAMIIQAGKRKYIRLV